MRGEKHISGVRGISLRFLQFRIILRPWGRGMIYVIRETHLHENCTDLILLFIRIEIWQHKMTSHTLRNWRGWVTNKNNQSSILHAWVSPISLVHTEKFLSQRDKSLVNPCLSWWHCISFSLQFYSFLPLCSLSSTSSSLETTGIRMQWSNLIWGP